MIELDRLLAPLQGELPQGVDLRRQADQTLLLDLRDAWRTARSREQRQDSDPGAAPPDWGAVERQASGILAEQSKDLEVAVWLCEALARTEGFAGLAAGGALIAGLAERFWPVLYPAPPIDEPEIGVEEARLQPL
jgi:type VI secretion system protein ImpA